MAKLPVLPARDLLKALGKAGFAVVSQRGSHIKDAAVPTWISEVALVDGGGATAQP